MLQKVFKTELTHGIRFRDDHSYTGVVGELKPHTLKLYDPEELGFDTITVKPIDVATYFRWHTDISQKFAPNTKPYNEAFLERHIAERCTPALDTETIDESMSLRDFEALRFVLLNGYTRTDEPAFVLEGGDVKRDGLSEVSKQVAIRLPTRQDMKDAEQRSGTTRMENSYLLYAHLIYLCTTFGGDNSGYNELTRPSFDSSIPTLSWDDFSVLLGAITNDATQYEPLSAVLEGVMETDGASLPFSAVAGEDAN